MANEFVVKNGLISQNNITVTGSISATAGITGSLSGTAQTASYVTTAQTASYVTTAQTASYVATAVSATTAQTASYVATAVSATTAQTASYASSFKVAGTLTAQTLVVQTITSSVDFVTGSTRFGTSDSNTHQFTGSVGISGSSTLAGDQIISGSLIVSTFGANGNAFSLDGNQAITGSLNVLLTSSLHTTSITGSLNVSGASTLNTTTVSNLTVTGSGTIASYNSDVLEITGSLIVTGSSIVTGSLAVNSTTQFGSSIGDTHQFVGIVNITGSSKLYGNQTITGSLTVSGSSTFTNTLTGTQGNFSLGTVGGAIGSVKNLTVANSNGAIGDWAGINFGYYNNTTNFAYIGSVLTSDAGNSKSDLVFGVKSSTSATSVTEYMRIASGGVFTYNASVGSNYAFGFNGSGSFAYGSSTTTRHASFAYNAGDRPGVELGYDVTNNNGVIAGATLTLGTGLDFWTYDGSSWASRMTLNKTGDLQFGNGSITWGYENQGIKLSKSGIGPKISLYASNQYLYLGYAESNGWERVYAQATSGGAYITNGATSWTANSDERLKNINSNIENAVDKLLTLRTVNYSWKSDELNRKYLGLIAQDVEKVLPELIDKDEKDEIGTLGIRYTEIIPVLVKAIQEQQVTIQELTTRLTALENK